MCFNPPGGSLCLGTSPSRPSRRCSRRSFQSAGRITMPGNPDSCEAVVSRKSDHVSIRRADHYAWEHGLYQMPGHATAVFQSAGRITMPAPLIAMQPFQSAGRITICLGTGAGRKVHDIRFNPPGGSLCLGTAYRASDVWSEYLRFNPPGGSLCLGTMECRLAESQCAKQFQSAGRITMPGNLRPCSCERTPSSGFNPPGGSRCLGTLLRD